MASPTYLGIVCNTVEDDSGTVTTISLPVTNTIPPDPHGCVILYVITAPDVHFGHSSGEQYVDPVAISDDQPDPHGTGQPGNAYSIVPNGFPVGLAYDFGIPPAGSVIPSCFDNSAGAWTGALNKHGSVLNSIQILPYWGLTIGTTITITLPPGIDGGAWEYAAAFALGYSVATPSAVALSARTLDPADVGAGDGSATPLGTRLISLLGFSAPTTYQFVALVVAADAAGAISDNQSAWGGGVAAGSSASNSFAWAVFQADGATIDQTQPIVQFDPPVGDSIDPSTGTAVTVTQIPVYTAPLGGTPIFNNHIRLSE